MSEAADNRFEVVVVGSGSGGGVLARRLADAGVRVALVEAGGADDHPAIADPRRSHDLWDSEVDWAYDSVPQPGAADRVIRLPRGRVLGGSSSMNGMIYVRGARADFDGWAALGNEGWAYADVLPLFKRSEDFDRGADEFHGAGGPLPVLTRYDPHPLQAAMVAAAVEAGIAFNDDPNGAAQDGVSFNQFTIRDGARQSVAATFLRPALERGAVALRLGATATRLRWEGERCRGVEIATAAGLETLWAEHEVIVCAGAIETPKLLLLSGLGPAAELAALGIAVVADLPGVGRGLQDHPICPVIFSSRQAIPAPMPGLPEMQTQMFWRSRSGLPAPDVQPLHFTTPHYRPWMEGPADAFTFNTGAVRPLSRGSVRLAAADPAAPPLVDPAFLTAAEDVEAIVASIELFREVARQPALAAWTEEELYPGPARRDRAALREYVRRAVTTYHHAAASCRMGVDEEAVVDPRLRVRGVAGLRIADASVMPSVTTGNTNAPTVMIGERAAELVLAELGSRRAEGVTP